MLNDKPDVGYDVLSWPTFFHENVTIFCGLARIRGIHMVFRMRMHRH
jgi:hypothetical protein